MTETIRLPQFLRDAEVRAESFDEDSHQIDVIWTTGATVRRRSWSEGEFDEELVVKNGSVRLDRLNGGAPFLNTHWNFDLRDVIGSVVPGSARITKGHGTARVQMSRRDEAAGIVQDIRDGVIRNISVGYRIHGIEKKERKDQIPLHRVVDWEPFEISAVPIPADSGAQVRAHQRGDPELFECRVTRALADMNEAKRISMRMRQRHVSFGR
jgi:phage head maturation protease